MFSLYLHWVQVMVIFRCAHFLPPLDGTQYHQPNSVTKWGHISWHASQFLHSSLCCVTLHTTMAKWKSLSKVCSVLEALIMERFKVLKGCLLIDWFRFDVRKRCYSTGGNSIYSILLSIFIWKWKNKITSKRSKHLLRIRVIRRNFYSDVLPCPFSVDKRNSFHILQKPFSIFYNAWFFSVLQCKWMLHFNVYFPVETACSRSDWSAQKTDLDICSSNRATQLLTHNSWTKNTLRKKPPSDTSYYGHQTGGSWQKRNILKDISSSV